MTTASYFEITPFDEIVLETVCKYLVRLTVIGLLGLVLPQCPG